MLRSVSALIHTIASASAAVARQGPPFPSLRLLQVAAASMSGHRNRAKPHSGWAPEYDPSARDAYLAMTQEERRPRYSCGQGYVPLAEIRTWAQETGLGYSPSRPGDSRALADQVSLYRGDITRLELDAVVNAANSSLMGGGGVDGAIHRAAGSQLTAECAQLGGCDTGDAKATCGYRMPARYVLHTVGPMDSGDAALASCYQRCLELVKQLRLKSVAFPCISTGVYSFPPKRAANIALRTVREFLVCDPYGASIDRVVFCVFMESDLRIYTDLLPNYFPTVKRVAKKAEVASTEERTKTHQSEAAPAEAGSEKHQSEAAPAEAGSEKHQSEAAPAEAGTGVTDGNSTEKSLK